MKLDGYQKEVNLSQQKTFEFLQNPHNFKTILPQNLTYFEATDTSVEFQMSGVPVKIFLKKLEEYPFSKIVYGSTKGITFQLIGNLSSTNDSTTNVELSFEGDINPMMKMMIEKPLRGLLESLTENLSKIS